MNAAAVHGSKWPPLRFSQVLMELAKKIDMLNANPSHVVFVSKMIPQHRHRRRDSVALDTPLPVPSFALVSYFLAQDRCNIAKAKATERAPAEARIGISKDDDSIMPDVGLLLKAAMMTKLRSLMM